MRHAALLLLGVLVAVSALSLRPGGAGVAVIGDGADAVAARLAPRVHPAPDPRVTGVTLRRWANLRHFPDIRCGRHCDGRAEVVVLLAPRPGGWRKRVLVDVSGGGTALDAGEGLPGALADCAAAQLAQEAERLRAGAACGWRRVVRWDLPLGL